MTTFIFPCEIYHHIATISNMNAHHVLNWIESDKEFYGPILSELYLKKKKAEDKIKLQKSVGTKPFIPQSKLDVKFEQETSYEDYEMIPIKIGSVDIGYLLYCETHWAMVCYIPKNKKITMDVIEKFPGYVIDDGSYGLITWVHPDKHVNISQAICEVWEGREFLRTNL
ncbi:hypothetical protein [Megavirus chiliensis]|uniref:Uncharacterized protein n=2 Tax=Megamimivirinae TaxID=3044648 RepID=A0A2L2DLA8_MIMIV|nr:hypothetical protein MegaChil _gp0105 [Megavirus chiliensis]AEQ32970.1 hypothetical protein [Megavirus chiliensis]AVG46945.1 hypothetical protein [Acanthamoeba polyphaga mimivirus]